MKFSRYLFLFLFVIGILVMVLLLVLISPSLGALVRGDFVGVVPVKGELITDTTNSIWGQTTGVREIIKELKAADEDPTVSVILLDINSGGGSVVASKELMRAVKKTSKPVVAYISDIGASGAYYVASAADVIVADEDSITGSIGVVAMVPNYIELFKKVGINMTILKEGKNKVMGNPFEKLTPEQRRILEGIVKDAYLEFRENVLKNREGKISVKKFDEIADGRLLNGRQALEYGLVDFVGSRELALEKAAELGNITGKPCEKLFAPSQSLFENLFGEVGYGIGKGLILALQKDTFKLQA